MRSLPSAAIRHSAFRPLLVLAAALLAARANGQERPPDAPRRVIVLAFDGVDPRRASEWMDSGELPNLLALAQEGTFARLETTNPADSPTSWASFVTSRNPGKTRVFGFVRPREGTYGIEPAIGLEERAPYGPGPVTRALAALAAGLVAFAAAHFAIRRLAGLAPRTSAAVALALGALVAGTASYALFALVPGTIARPLSAREGKAFWDPAAEAGLPVVSLFAPMSYPATGGEDCHLLCGFGVPDLTGTMGTWALYSSRVLSERESPSAGRLVPIARQGRVATTIAGPGDLLAAEEAAGIAGRLDAARDERERRALREDWLAARSRLAVAAPLAFEIDRAADEVAIEAGGTRAVLSPGEWTDWMELDFVMNPVLSVRGMVRFRLLSVAPEVEIYMTPVQFVPDDLPPGAALSSPEDWAGRWWEDGHRFPTLGWPTATNALKDERIDEAAFFETVRQEFEAQRELALAALEEGDWRLLLAFFYAPDRASHLFWRLLDPASPRYDAQIAARYGDAVLETYRWMDELVGEVRRRHVDDSTVLFVVSDHGFAPFRKEVDLNAWLRERGHLALVPGAEPPVGLESVDWSRTRAYSVGLGSIRLNLAGREPEGTVRPEESRELEIRIARELEGLRDPDSGEAVVVGVHSRDELYRGPHVREAPDLQIGFAEGYRIGWETSLGGIGERVVALNRSKWSGDHVSVDPGLVPGVLFSNRRVRAEPARVVDVGPTILSILGVARPDDLDGVPLSLMERRP